MTGGIFVDRLRKRLAMYACLLAVLIFMCASASAADLSAAAYNTVKVSTIDEFLAAIAPNTQIILAEGEYNLTEAANYSRGGSAYYHWEGGYDGYELVITDVDNLSIIGSEENASVITTEPRYANVLRFDNAENLSIGSVMVGHTREQGYCTGGVLYLENCSDVEISDAMLYGCGTYGISLYQCSSVHVTDSDIYECSYGCMEVSNCTDLLVENSKFYSCSFIFGGFSFYSSSNIALINSEISNNTGDEYSSVFSVDCQNVYLGGLDIHDNDVAAVFGDTSIPITVESCRFSGITRWANGEIPAVSPEGNQLSAEDLQQMKMRIVTWASGEKSDVPEVTSQEDGKIHVSSVDEFLAALGSNVTIYLEQGEYNLSRCDAYAGTGSNYYRWNRVSDGYELEIFGANNLTIEAESPETTAIVAESRYANVISFSNLSGLIVRNIKLGHTQGSGSCTGGVIQLSSASSPIIEGCKLYGCGILGVQAFYCSNLNIFNCEIYECSSGAASFFACSTIRVEKCNVHDIGQDGQSSEPFYADPSCTDVLIDND